MKGLRVSLLLPMTLFCISLFLSVARAQNFSVPAPGDLAILQISTSNPDYVAIQVLRDRLDLRGIFFTDNGWQETGSFRATEGNGSLPSDMGWDNVPINTVVELGTSITLDSDSSDGFLGAPFPQIRSPSLAQTGDQFFLYAFNGTTTEVLCGIHTYGNWWDSVCTSAASSVRPPGDGNFIAIGQNGSNRSVSNAHFQIESGDAGLVGLAQARAMLTDRANWSYSATRPDDRSFSKIRVGTSDISPTPTVTQTPEPTPTPTTEILNSEYWRIYE